MEIGSYLQLILDPLVVDEETANSLSQNTDFLKECNHETVNILKDSGFFTDSNASSQLIPEEGVGLGWNILRYGIILIGILSILLVLVLIPYMGIPIGNKIISKEAPLWINIIYLLAFIFLTSILHELMHIVYARTWKYNAGRIKLLFKKAVAVVPMTHIWVWTITSRITALAAGVIFDLLLLACLSWCRLFFDNWMIVSGASILWLKILWQFGFHRNCDGHLLAMTILDDPLIDLDTSNLESNIKNKKLYIWKVLKVFGYMIDLLLIIFWLIPFLVSLFNYLK